MRFRFLHLGLLAFVLAASTPGRAEGGGDFYHWTLLQPENDSCDVEERDYDEFNSKQLIHAMNLTEKVFRHHLAWNKIAIKDLLQSPSPYCELHFDAVHPLILTDREKTILREYLTRGGFILFIEDTYPYPEETFWSIKSWPVIDFITKELPASDPGFKVERITDAHPIFHQCYQTRTADAVRHELEGNPSTPNRTLLSYRQHPSALVIGSYNYLVNGHWEAEPRPFRRVFSLDPRSYQLNVNIYVYVSMH